MDNETKYSKNTPISLREERRRTGRYIAAALAMCITLLGLHQAVVHHTPGIAGLFAPAIIMFLYVFWVLYTASKTQKEDHISEEDIPEEIKIEIPEKIENKETKENTSTEVTSTETSSDTTPILPKKKNSVKENNILAEKFKKIKLNRTYSIA